MSKQQATPKRHHYTDCGLDNVWIEGGFEEVSTPYGKGIAIEDMDGLHRCIAEWLIEKPSALTGAEFRFLRTELDLSQFSLGQLCGRTERTIRDWETRNASVDEPANRIIRFIYEQRTNPSVNFEKFSEQLQRIRALDKECHELELAFRNAGKGWKKAA